MKYEYELVHITDTLTEHTEMYSLALLRAKGVTLTLSGIRCYLDGTYIICLNSRDTLSVHGGYCETLNLRFLPYFYNVNLNHEVIGMIFYDEMRDKYGYPDFRLFRMRNEGFFGVIPVNDNEYETARAYFVDIQRNIDISGDDVMWSCRVRSDMISVLHIAEGAYLGKLMGMENEILRYIYDNIGNEITLDGMCQRFNTNRTTLTKLIKEKTGMAPMQYVLEVRLNHSKPELLFTKLPINELAEKYGFSDANYYIRAFKKRFGVTPLKFRSEGWDSRIRDEHIYHEKERNMLQMTEKDFADYLKKGLGRAILDLKKADDAEKFKPVFRDYIFTVGKKARFRHYGIYEKELLDIFGADFRNEIIDKILAEIEKEENDIFVYSAYFSLLDLLGYRTRITNIIEARYKDAYSRLLEYTKKPWDGEKCPDCAKDYMYLAGCLGRTVKVGDRRIKEILFDIADLYDYTDTPVIPTYQNPLFMMWDGVGREYFFTLLDEVIKEHRNGSRIDIRKEFVFGDANDQTPPVPTAEQVLAHKELRAESLRDAEGLKYADEETVKAVAAAAIAETDMEKKLYLLNCFAIRFRSPEEPTTEFPLDPEPLVEMAEKEDFEIRREPPYGVTEAVLQILANNRHPAARRVGLKLFYDNSRSEASRYYAIQIRFGKNYIPEEDKADFSALLRSPNTKERNAAISVFLDDIRQGINDLPLEMVPYVFANSDEYSHEALCKALAEKNLMPEELKTECMYDANKKIRALFLNTQKKKK